MWQVQMTLCANILFIRDQSQSHTHRTVCVPFGELFIYK